MHKQRIQKLQQHITKPLLIKKKENLTYLAGKEFEGGEGWLLVFPYAQLQLQYSPSYHKRREGGVLFFGSGLEKVEEFNKVESLRNLGNYIQAGQVLTVEDYFTYAEGKFLKYKLPKVKLSPIASPVDALRLVKDNQEIALVKKSMEIVAKVFLDVKKQLRKKQGTEIALAQFIQNQGLKYGAEAVSFPAIVASGLNAAVPHHVPGNRKLVPNESIIIDFGFKYKGYCSDFTRTVFLKSVPKKLEIAYNQTEAAYKGVIASVNGRIISAPTQLKAHNDTSVIMAGVLHKKAVDILAEKKLEKYFIHSLGHGTGLEIHEKPNIYNGSKDKLVDGMVFSIEPGVYFPRIGGIRIEDLVYLKNGKIEKFIEVPTKLTDNII